MPTPADYDALVADAIDNAPPELKTDRAALLKASAYMLGGVTKPTVQDWDQIDRALERRFNPTSALLAPVKAAFAQAVPGAIAGITRDPELARATARDLDALRAEHPLSTMAGEAAGQLAAPVTVGLGAGLLAAPTGPLAIPIGAATAFGANLPGASFREMVRQDELDARTDLTPRQKELNQAAQTQLDLFTGGIPGLGFAGKLAGPTAGLVRRAAAQGAEEAVLSGAQNVGEQGIDIGTDVRESFSPGELAANVAGGALLGTVAGGGIDLVSRPIESRRALADEAARLAQQYPEAATSARGAALPADEQLAGIADALDEADFNAALRERIAQAEVQPDPQALLRAEGVAKSSADLDPVDVARAVGEVQRKAEWNARAQEQIDFNRRLAEANAAAEADAVQAELEASVQPGTQELLRAEGLAESRGLLDPIDVETARQLAAEADARNRAEAQAAQDAELAAAQALAAEHARQRDQLAEAELLREQQSVVEVRNYRLQVAADARRRAAAEAELASQRRALDEARRDPWAAQHTEAQAELKAAQDAAVRAAARGSDADVRAAQARIRSARDTLARTAPDARSAERAARTAERRIADLEARLARPERPTPAPFQPREIPGPVRAEDLLPQRPEPRADEGVVGQLEQGAEPTAPMPEADTVAGRPRPAQAAPAPRQPAVAPQAPVATPRALGAPNAPAPSQPVAPPAGVPAAAPAAAGPAPEANAGGIRPLAAAAPAAAPAPVDAGPVPGAAPTRTQAPAAPAEVSPAPAPAAQAPTAPAPNRPALSEDLVKPVVEPLLPPAELYPDSLMSDQRVAAGIRGLGATPREVMDHPVIAVARKLFTLFQGNKGSMLPHAAYAVLSRIPKATREGVTHMDERFGGSGAYGLALWKVGLFPNLRRIDIGEFDPERASRLQWVFDHGGELPAVLARSKDKLVDAIARATEADARTAGDARSWSAVKARLDAWMETAQLDDGERVVLRSLIDMNARSEQDPVRFLLKNVDSLVAMYETAQDFRQQGGNIAVTQGDSYARPVTPGPQVMSVLDPPYFATEGYDGSTVGADTYRKTGDLIRRMAEADNNILYNDSGWMASKGSTPMGERAQDALGEALPAYQDITGVLPATGLFKRPGSLGENFEILGVRHAGEPVPQRNQLTPPQPQPQPQPPLAGPQPAAAPGQPAQPTQPAGAASPAGSAPAGIRPLAEPSAAPANPPAAGRADAPITDAERADAEALKPLFGEGLTLSRLPDGAILVEGVDTLGRPRAQRIEYNTLQQPSTPEERQDWLNSMLGEGMQAAAKRLYQASQNKLLGLPPFVAHAARALARGDEASVRSALAQLSPNSWGKVIRQFPTTGNMNTGARIVDSQLGDVGALIRIDNALRGKAGAILEEEVGHTLWEAMRRSDPALVERILQGAPPDVRRTALDANGKLRRDLDAVAEGRILEWGTGAVNNAVWRTHAKAKADAASAADRSLMGRIRTWLREKLAAFRQWMAKRRLTQLDPLDEAAKRWLENQDREGARFGGPARPGPDDDGPGGGGGGGTRYSVQTTPADVALGARRAAADEAREVEGRTEDEVLAAADAILADPEKLAEMDRRFAEGTPLPEDIVATTRSAMDVLVRAVDTGKSPRGGITPGAFAYFKRRISQAQPALSSAGRLLHFARRDMHPEQIRLRLLTTLADTGSKKWRDKMAQASTDEERAAVNEEWARSRRAVVDEIKQRFGVDILDPKLGERLAAGGYSTKQLLGNLRRGIEDANDRQDGRFAAWKKRATFGGAIAELTRGAILTATSPIPQAMFPFIRIPHLLLRRQAAKLLGHVQANPAAFGSRSPQAFVRDFTADALTAWDMVWQGLREGRSVVREQLTGRTADEGLGEETTAYENDRAVLPLAVRGPLGPGAVLTGMVDDFVWAITYQQAARIYANRQGADVHHPDIVDAAMREADAMTLRGAFEGPLKGLAEGLGKLRSPTMRTPEGELRTNPTGVLLHQLMPIYKSVVKAMVKGAEYAWLPGSIGAIRRGVEPDEKAQVRRERAAEIRKVSAGQIREEEHAAAAEGAARLVLGAAALLVGGIGGAASQMGLPDDERRVRDMVDKPGTVFGVPANRFSPIYEPMMAGAILRDTVQDFSKRRAKGEDTTGAAVSSAAGGLWGGYEAIIDRPLAPNLPSGNRINPVSGKSETIGDQLAAIPQRNLAVGSLYPKTQRLLLDKTARRATKESPFLQQYEGAGRPQQSSILGGKQSTGTGRVGILQRAIFGTSAKLSPEDERLLRRVIRLNDKLDISDPAVAADKDWWKFELPAASTSKRPALEDGGQLVVGTVREGFNGDEREVIRAIAGTLFRQYADAVPEALPASQQLAQLKGAWAAARRQALATAEAMQMQRLAEEQKTPGR